MYSHPVAVTSLRLKAMTADASSCIIYACTRVPSRFPTVYLHLLIVPISDAKAEERGEEAANLSVEVARYRGPVSMLKVGPRFIGGLFLAIG